MWGIDFDYSQIRDTYHLGSRLHVVKMWNTCLNYTAEALAYN